MLVNLIFKGAHYSSLDQTLRSCKSWWCSKVPRHYDFPSAHITTWWLLWSGIWPHSHAFGHTVMHLAT